MRGFGSDDRRRAARIFGDFPLILLDDDGAPLDARATAHDLSERGFKIESCAELKPGAFFRFSLSLDAGEQIEGRARVVWSEKTELSFWAGGEFLGMAAGDRRRVRRATSPSGVDWDALADKAILVLSVLLALVVGRILLSATSLRR